MASVFVTIFEQLVPISGGGTSRIKSVINALVDRGHDVSVAASLDTDIKDALQILRCNRVFPLRNVSRLDKHKMEKYLLYTPFNISKVVAVAKKVKPDILIAHNSIAGFAGLLAKKVTGCSVIVDMTDLLFEYLSDYSEQSSWTVYLQKIGVKIEDMVTHRADRIITISYAMKEKLVQKGADPEKVDVIYDGVKLDLFTADETGAYKLRRNYARRAEKIVMFHGVIDPQDRPEILAEAAVYVLKRKPHTMFWVVGDGVAVPLIKDEVRRRGIEKHFFFSGWLPFENVPRFISACDVGLVILPKTTSGEVRVTLKGFEYWACGKPIVASDLPALKEVVTPWRTGLLYKADDSIDLAEKIIVLLEDEELAEKMGKAGRELVQRRYNWSKLAAEFVTVCEDLQLSFGRA